MTDIKKNRKNVDSNLNYTGDKGPAFGVRYGQVLVMSFSVAVAFSTKAMFSVAIVAMTDETTSPNKNIPTYHWDNTNVVLSSVIWGGIPFNIIAGYLGKTFGPKWFSVVASFINSAAFALIPLAASLGGSWAVIACRLIQGAAIGTLIPLNPVVQGRWIPPEERSRLSFAGTCSLTVFVMICSVASGYIAESQLGWPYVFYTIGGFGLAWTIFYMYYAVQSPQVHETITPGEKEYLQNTLFKTSKVEIETPWKEILTSRAVWAIIIGHTGYYWYIVLIASDLSLYFAHVLNYDLKTNGTISAIPTLVGTIAGIFIAILSDYLPKNGYMRTVNARRMFHLSGIIGLSGSLVFMTFIPSDYRIWAVVLICVGNICIMLTGIGGTPTNLLDISPRFAGVIMGLSQTLSQSVALFAPLCVQWICTDMTDRSQWRLLFIVSTIISVSCAIFFVIFATDKRQLWDRETDREAELEVKKRKSSIISLSLAR